MAKVKFKVKALDKDTRIEYPVSDTFVEVSDDFIRRLKDYDKKGEMFEFENTKPELFNDKKHK